MNKEELNIFLESGIIERYIIGEATPDEEELLLELAGKHNEIAEALHKSEMLIHQIVKGSEIELPQSLSDRIFRRTSAKPRFDVFKFSSLAFAAMSTVLLWFYVEVSNNFTENKADFQALQIECDEQSENYAGLKSVLEMVSDTATIRVALNPTQEDALSSALVWFNRTSGEVILSTSNLEGLDQDFDYQLWAIIDNVPVSMGVVEIDEENKFVRVDFRNNPAAFAISIEPKGGSESPTSERIIAVGAL
jgi:hypothetical protein